jgi:hypothetical protein
MPEGSSASDVRVVTVTTEDAVAALEANLRGDRGLVLRLTPPFHGRQRARLHRPSTPAGSDRDRDGSTGSDADEDPDGEPDPDPTPNRTATGGESATSGTGPEAGTDVGGEPERTAGGETAGDDGPSPAGDRAVHVDPASLFPDAPAYPEADETAARLRADGTYDPDRHYEAHAERVAEWRRSVREARAESVTLDTASGPHRVSVRWLG